MVQMCFAMKVKGEIGHQPVKVPMAGFQFGNHACNSW